MKKKHIEPEEHYRCEDDKIGDPGIYKGNEILEQLEIFGDIDPEEEFDIIDIRDDGGQGYTIA